VFYIYKILLENNKYYIGITDKETPENSVILFKTKNRDDIPGMAEAIHNNTKQDPNRIFELPKKPERKKRMQSFETRKKIREYRLGKAWNKETKNKISNTIKDQYKSGKRKATKSNLYQTFSKETRAKMQEAHKKRELLTCSHCGEAMAINMYKRWHGDNCKFNW